MIIAFPHRPQKHGGPGSFQKRMEVILKRKGWEIIYPESKKRPDVILVVGGTRKIGWLLKQKLRGVPIVYRLDGINWLHRKIKVAPKLWILNEIRNLIFQVIRAFFATHIIYQSSFVQRWWQKKGWKTNADHTIIHNGVDINKFKPQKTNNELISILAVEGNLDYSPYAVELLNRLQEEFIDRSPFESLVLYGGFQSDESRQKLSNKIDYRGKVSRKELPGVYKNAVYLSLDVNAACPNTVIEALASGIPVIGFDTGALNELVPKQAGEIVPYGSDPWELGFPDAEKLYEGALRVGKKWKTYAEEARRHAEKNFDIEDIVAQYIGVIESQLKGSSQLKKKVHYFTNLAPHYRAPLWELMAKDRTLEFNFYFGKPLNQSIKEISFENGVWGSNLSRINNLKNRRLFNRIVWQSGVLAKAMFADIQTALFLGDMNIISTWLAAIVLRIRGAKVYFWGHGFSGDESFFKKHLRILFNQLAHQHFIYGQRAKNLMTEYGFDASNIHTIHNSLDYEKHKKLRQKAETNGGVKSLFSNPEQPILAFIGRLTAVKKLDLLIEAVHRLNKEGDSYNLLIIGDGPMRESLEVMAKDLLTKGSYHFYGACYDENEIGRLLSNADLCVSPGNVGLTAIHSLSFGTPVCSHNNMPNQMPEVEAIIPGHTGFLFEEDNVDDLVLNIKKWFDRPESREKLRQECYDVIDQKYNPHRQIEIFEKVLLNNE